MFASPLTRAVDDNVPVRHSYPLVSLLTFLVAILIKPASIFCDFWLRWQMSSLCWWRLPDLLYTVLSQVTLPGTETGQRCPPPPPTNWCVQLRLAFVVFEVSFKPWSCCQSHDAAAWSPGWPQRATWYQTCSIRLLKPVPNTDLFNDNKLETTKELGGDIKSLKKA